MKTSSTQTMFIAIDELKKDIKQAAEDLIRFTERSFVHRGRGDPRDIDEVIEDSIRLVSLIKQHIERHQLKGFCPNPNKFEWMLSDVKKNYPQNWREKARQWGITTKSQYPEWCLFRTIDYLTESREVDEDVKDIFLSELR